MIDIIELDNKSIKEIVKCLKKRNNTADVRRNVEDIIEDIKENGNKALREYTLKFDKADLKDFLVSEEEINNALKTARLYDFVKGLKDGLLTDVGQAGSALSGGQKQRLALARVILADRPMIIFDEATSNIDVESEESIWEAIYELSKDKTILVISHRLANVTEAKNIYVMNKGILVENGTHDELMKNESCYYEMVNKQNELEMIREVC